METEITKNKISLVSKNKNTTFLFTVLFVALIFLGLISTELIILTKVSIVILGLIAIALVSVLALTDLRKLTLVFVLYIPFSRMIPGDFGTGIWAFNLTNVFLILILFSLMINNIGTRGSLLLKSSLNLPLILMIFLVTISFANSSFHYGYSYFDEFFSIFKQWLTPMFFFFIFLLIVRDKQDIKEFARLIIVISLFIAVLVVVEYLKVRGVDDFEKMRVGALFEQPNSAGAFFVYYGFLIVGFFLIYIRSARYWLLILPILVSMRALMYTYSRGAIVAFVFAGLFITFVKNKLIFILLCLLLIYTYLNPSILPSSLQYRFSSTFVNNNSIYTTDLQEQLEPSAQNRILVWKGAIEMIKDNPIFGVGYGAEPFLMPYYAPVGKMDTHNTYLSIATELGLIGLAIFLWIIICIIKNTWFVYRRTKDKFIKAFALGFLAGVVGLLVCNMFGSRMDSQELTGLFWILTALIFRAKQLIRAGQL